MKKLMILAVALFSMTTTFAADENASATTATAAAMVNGLVTDRFDRLKRTVILPYVQSLVP